MSVHLRFLRSWAYKLSMSSISCIFSSDCNFRSRRISFSLASDFSDSDSDLCRLSSLRYSPIFRSSDCTALLDCFDFEEALPPLEPFFRLRGEDMRLPKYSPLGWSYFCSWRKSRLAVLS